MAEAIDQFSMAPTYWDTKRRETRREAVGKGPAKPIDVHLYELYWADLSRPHAFSFLNSFLAFLNLLFSACGLGRKSINEVISRVRQAGKTAELRWLQSLAICHRLMEQIITAGLLTLNLWLAGAGWTYYLLTLDQPTHDGVVPTILGFAAVGVCLWRLLRKTPSSIPWQATAIIATAIGLFSVCLAFQIGSKIAFWRWLLTLICGVLPSGLLATLYFRRPEMKRFAGFAFATSLVAISVLFYEFCLKLKLQELADIKSAPTGLKGVVILWSDSICGLLSLVWLTLALLSVGALISAGALSVISWRNDVSAPNARAVRTTLISCTAPAVILLVVTLGIWQIVAWVLGVHGSAVHISDHYLWPVHYNSSFLGKPNEVLHAAKLWYAACQHPWIELAYLWFIVIATFLGLSVAPNIVLEVIGPTKRYSQEFATWVGRATDALYQGLTFSGLAIAKLMGILAPLVILAVAYFTTPVLRAGQITPLGQQLFVSAAVAYLAATLCLRFVWCKGQYDWTTIGLAALNACVTSIAIGIVALKFDLNIVWALPLSALLLLGGIAFIFRTILNVGLDVVNWLRVTPRDSNPRGKIIARLWALLQKIDQEKEGYDGLVIVAHSQGTIIIVEFLRYLQWINLRLKHSIHLFTVGCPLRQLYNRRFPDLYSWVGTTPEEARQQLKPPAGVLKWLNGYTTGDYIGRNLWTTDAERDIASNTPRIFDENREEICLGAGAHIHYFDWRLKEMANLLDDLIVEAADGHGDLGGSKPKLNNIAIATLAGEGGKGRIPRIGTWTELKTINVPGVASEQIEEPL
jgi:hypothetical protein